MATIKAPNSEYEGTVGGVAFTGGEAETDDDRMVSWFREHGYGAEGAEAGEGRALRDAAEPPEGVEVQPGDEAPPPPTPTEDGAGVEQQPVNQGERAQRSRRT